MSPLRRTYWFPNRRDQTILLKTKAHPFETDAPLFVLCPLPRGERPNHCTLLYRLSFISIHAPAWGATYCYWQTQDKKTLFQSTLPRGERRRLTEEQTRYMYISIHAPTWGATPPGGREGRRPAPYFNPRSHVGSDVTYNYIVIYNYISIHAPTWGATCRFIDCVQRILHFNPRSHVGSDCTGIAPKAGPSDFNPRSHVGSDSEADILIRSAINFNPRSHVGSDFVLGC